jgi:very-short-patch-repair endonuclease
MSALLPIPNDTRLLLRLQDGVITREQALGTGASPRLIARLVRDERWSPLERGVFCQGLAEPTFRQRAWAGALLGGDRAALGGGAALSLAGAFPEPQSIQVVLPAESRRRLPLRYSCLHDNIGRLAHRRGILPCVRMEDAILDLAPELDLEGFVGVVTDAARLRITTLPRVRRALAGRSRVARRGDLEGVLLDLEGLESKLEYLYQRDVEAAHRLPRSRRQPTSRLGRIDACYEEYQLLVELDGRLGHLSGRFRDLERDNGHALLALTTLRYGSFDVRDRPCAVAGQVCAALQLRGWPGCLERCPRCPAEFDASGKIRPGRPR